MIFSIILYPYHFIKSKIRDVLSSFDVKYDISKKVSHVISLSIWLLCCYLAAIFIYTIFYNLYIPIVHQSSKLAFTKTEFGSTARVYNSRDEFPLCQNSLLHHIHQSAPFNKTCMNPLHFGSKIEFVDQDYHIKIKLDLNEQVHKPQDNVLTSSFEVINKNNQVLEVVREGLTNIPTETYTLTQMMDLMKKGVGLGDSEHHTEVILSEKFANAMFGIHVININIPQSHAFITKGTIVVEAILSGLGRFMYYWFWSSAILFINIICLATILGQTFGKEFALRALVVAKVAFIEVCLYTKSLQIILNEKKEQLVQYYYKKVQKQKERIEKVSLYKQRAADYSERVIQIQKQKASGLKNICSRRKNKVIHGMNKLD